jgi:hypothetical protein
MELPDKGDYLGDIFEEWGFEDQKLVKKQLWVCTGAEWMREGRRSSTSRYGIRIE